MGLDFITRCTPTFQRSWDAGRERLAQQDLFTRHPELEDRRFRLSPEGPAAFAEGELLLLRSCEGQVVAFRGRERVGELGSPPAVLLDVVAAGCGSACARVAHVHARSGAADITLIQ